MFIQVVINEGSPVNYNLGERTDILLGSHPDVDIVIIDDSISRKHLRINRTEGKWFATDKGSTNGSYLDEFQLVPGSRKEVKINDSIRMGANVEITLLESAQNAIPIMSLDAKKAKQSHDRDNKTQVVSLAALKAAKLASEKKKRMKALEVKLANERRKKEESKNTAKIIIICVAVVVAGFGLNKLWQMNLKEKKKETIVKKIQRKNNRDMELDSELDGVRIENSKLIPRNNLLSMLQNPKCLTEEEKTICDAVPILKAKDNGMVIFNKENNIFFIEEGYWRKKVDVVFEKRGQINQRLVDKTVFLLFIKENFIFTPPPLPETSYFYIAFFEKGEVAHTLKSVGAFRFNQLSSLIAAFEEAEFMNPQTDLEVLIKKSDTLYILY